MSSKQNMNCVIRKGKSIQYLLSLHMFRCQLEMHGPETARILRKELHFKEVIIGIQYDRKTTNELLITILSCLCLTRVTGNALPADVATFLESGANELIIKPMTKLKRKGNEGELFLPVYQEYFSSSVTSAIYYTKKFSSIEVQSFNESFTGR